MSTVMLMLECPGVSDTVLSGTPAANNKDGAMWRSSCGVQCPSPMLFVRAELLAEVVRVEAVPISATIADGTRT